MTAEKIRRLRVRGWENMIRIALRYPSNCKRRVFAKWDNRNQRLGKKLKRLNLGLKSRK